VKTETFQEHDYLYSAAGRVWVIPTLTLQRLPGGDVVLQLSEIRRIHCGIANQICGEPGGLSVDAFEFLCSVTESSFAEVARELQIVPSTLTKWRGRGTVMPPIRSLVLKKWFWFKLFGDGVGERSVHIRLVRDDAEFLQYVRDQAIAAELADEFAEQVA